MSSKIHQVRRPLLSVRNGVRMRSITEQKNHLKNKVPQESTVTQEYLHVANTSQASKLSSVANARERRQFRKSIDSYRKSCSNHLRVLCLNQQKLIKNLVRLQNKLKDKQGETEEQSGDITLSQTPKKEESKTVHYVPMWQKSSKLPNRELDKFVPKLRPYSKNSVIDAKYVPSRRLSKIHRKG